MTPSSTFEITRRNPGINASGKYGTVGVTSASRGVALGAHATAADSFDLATHANFIGFLTRRVTPSGLSLTDRIFGVTSDTPVGVEAPFKAGEEVTVEKAHEVEVEGSDYLYSGTGQITGLTAVGSQLSFINGQIRVAQGSEIVRATLTANNLAPSDGTGVGSTLRIRFEMVTN